jgi:NADH-quinone oxidoreductase subunit N
VENIAFLPIGPEVVLLAGAVLVLMAGVALKLGSRDWAIVAGISLVASFLLSWVQWLRVDDLGRQLSFSARGVSSPNTPMVVMDAFSAFGGMVLFAVAILAVTAAWRLVVTLGERGPEFVALLLLATAGLHIMIISANLILLFIGLETASIALYVVAGFTRTEPNSDESAMKYFLLGSFASAIFLYGIALVFAATGSLSIYGGGGILTFFRDEPVPLLDVGVLLAGISLMLTGLGFKISAAPFHQWAPDVYQGAASGAVPLMTAGVKVAGIATVARVLVGTFETRVDDWAPVIAVIAALSVVVGTLGAIAQRDVKRMLAYSGVAHAGFMLTGLVGGVAGIPAVWFYLATYAIQLVGAFIVVTIVSGSTSGRSSFDDYQGLARRSPWVAAAMATFMLGMGGIPIFTGFVGKIGVFGAAIGAGYLWLVIVGLVASVAGLFFYLRIIVLMYFQDGEAPAPVTTLGAGSALAVAAAVTLIVGVVPWPLLNLVQHALF